VQENLQFIVVA